MMENPKLFLFCFKSPSCRDLLLLTVFAFCVSVYFKVAYFQSVYLTALCRVYCMYGLMLSLLFDLWLDFIIYITLYSVNCVHSCTAFFIIELGLVSFVFFNH